MSDPPSSDARRPRALHTSRSFTRLESPTAPASPSRLRASTIQTPTIHRIPEAKDITAKLEPATSKRPDIFESVDEDEEHGGPDDDNDEHDAASKPPGTQPIQTVEDLPVELRSLIDRFLRQLSAKVHATPLNIEQISDQFQDFYIQAESHIRTHIAALATKLANEKTPNSSVASSKPAPGKGLKRTTSHTPDEGSTGEQQMLSTAELNDRRKARRRLEQKRVALEEAVERGVCEKLYDRVYRHRSTDDEEQDSKLRSKTAALSLIGIGLKELHVDITPSKDGPAEDASAQNERIQTSLAPAREALQRMDDEHFPLGKLQKLTEAHKSIVETLSDLFPSSSSADEVLPTLIYTLITSPPDSINVISNLHFIQHFRAHSKVDGEAAYCLVNLEAAISFLETVDLSSLRADELPQGPPKSSSRPPTPNAAAAPIKPSEPTLLTPGLTAESAIASDLSSGDKLKAFAPPPPLASPSFASRPAMTQRRLSSLIQAQAERIEAGREELLNSADQAFDAINSTLENSFQFLFGRLKEKQGNGSDSSNILPKTLEEARQLVSSPTLMPEDVPSRSARSSVHDVTNSASPDDPLRAKTPDRDMLSIVGGRLRDRSVDSNRSGGSNRRVAFNEKHGDKGAVTPTTAADQVGNLMNSLNPLKSFGGFGRFGRAASATSTPPPGPAVVDRSKQLGNVAEKEGEKMMEKTSPGAAQTDFHLNSQEALAELKRTKPPVRRFMEVKDASELRIGEVEELLKDYRRLATALREAINP